MTSDWHQYNTNTHQNSETEILYFLPHPLLRTDISHYMVYQPALVDHDFQTKNKINIVPDASGCIVCNATEQGVNSEYWGPSSKVVQVAAQPKESSLYVIIDFLPGGANRLLNMPLSSLHNVIIGLEFIDQNLADLLSRAFEQHILKHHCVNLTGFFNFIDQIFLERNKNLTQLNLTQYLVDTIKHSLGSVTIEALAQQTGYSKRHLGRIVTERLGMNIKLLSRVIRINYACHMIERETYSSLTQLSYRLGYYDQPHFIHDFSTVCGVTPRNYQQNMSYFYNENLKLATIV